MGDEPVTASFGVRPRKSPSPTARQGPASFLNRREPQLRRERGAGEGRQSRGGGGVVNATVRAPRAAAPRLLRSDPSGLGGGATCPRPLSRETGRGQARGDSVYVYSSTSLVVLPLRLGGGPSSGRSDEARQG